MNREQMRAALKSINVSVESDSPVNVGIMLAKAQAWITSTAANTTTSSKGILDGLVVGFKYQRALDMQRLTK